MTQAEIEGLVGRLEERVATSVAIKNVCVPTPDEQMFFQAASALRQLPTESTTIGSCDVPPRPSPRFWFSETGFENTPHPCICVDDPLGGDPKILALISVIYRPTDLHGLCQMANAYMDSLEVPNAA